MGLLQYIRSRRERRSGSAPRHNTVALCLGGGGARGFGHLGALKAFEEAGLDFPICVGTSVGSMVGALYCAGIEVDKMIDYAHKMELDDIRKGAFFRSKEAAPIGKVITDIVPEKNIEELKKRFAAIAVDLKSARQIILDHGSIADAVSASCCVPVLFKPVIIGNMHLVDGGVLNTIPADVCRMFGADKVVSIDINSTRGEGSDELGTLDIIKTVFGIISSAAAREGLRQSDVIIKPDLKRFKATKKDGYEEMIENGYEAALRHIPEIKMLFEGTVSVNN